MRQVQKNLVAAGALILAGVLGYASKTVAQDSVVEATALHTATFAVEKMTCATCPITVKTAIQRVEGVRSVDVDFEAKTATVTFDATIVAPAQIAQASLGAGYPAHHVAAERLR